MTKKNCNCEHDEYVNANLSKPPQQKQCECNKDNEYLELAQRIKAEFDNYKKRNAEIASISFNNGVATVVSKLLPALDAFKQAKSNIKDEQVLVGVDMILGQILNSLQEMGVQKISALGKPFDANFHNAVLVGTDETKADNEVLEEYQEGFILKDKVIRHSVVKINKLS